MQKVTASSPAATGNERPRKVDELVEKKSISFPIVNGTSIETELDTSNKPTATARGLDSGLAKEISFRTLLAPVSLSPFSEVAPFTD